ncbi:MAG: hypothetical protein AAF938_14905 [Myxococcota bacterium]
MNRLAFVFGLFVWVGCGDDAAGDVGVRDVGSASDAAREDASRQDAGRQDAGPAPDGSGSIATRNDDGTISIDFAPEPGAAPALSPTIAQLTYIGGPGDQYVRSVGFAEDGSIVAQGEGFTLTFAPDGSGGAIEGDVGANDEGDFARRPNLPGDPGQEYVDTRNGLSYTVGFRQAGGNLQIPIFRAFEGGERIWLLWGHAVNDVRDADLGADSRCYQAWAMPDGNIGVQCWTDGGNSVLTKGPRDLTTPGFNPSWAEGAFQNSAGGMSSMVALVDPSDGGSVISGTFMNSHVGHLTTDGWGRLYIAQVAGSRFGGGEPANPFGQSGDARSGVMVLDPTLRNVLFNARIGGTCSDGLQAFGDVAVRGDLLVAGGTTCASDLATVNAIQASPGGGQDGMVLILRLR